MPGGPTCRHEYCHYTASLHRWHLEVLQAVAKACIGAYSAHQLDTKVLGLMARLQTVTALLSDYHGVAGNKCGNAW